MSLRMHPNGFLQYDISEIARLHVWHPALPQGQKRRTPIHDHTFDLESEIVMGRLTHRWYQWVPQPNGPLQRYESVGIGGQDTELQPTGMFGDVELIQETSYTDGMSYRFYAGLFHESIGTGLTATIMHRMPPSKSTREGFPKTSSVLVARHMSPDNDFRRDQYPEEALMPFVEQVIEHLRWRPYLSLERANLSVLSREALREISG